MEKDMTTGSVFRNLVSFSFPVLLANILQSFYGIVDMVVIGRFVGSDGLAAVSNAAMAFFIINAVCIGMCIGGSVLAAQYKGARDRDGLNRTIGTLFSLSLLAAAIITAAGLAFSEEIFLVLRVPLAALPHATAYMRILCAGTVFVVGYNTVCAVLRGLGDARSPLVFVAIATVINVALDFLLVGVIPLGTRGAALATVAAQGFSCLVSLAALRRRRSIFDFALKSLRIDRQKSALILRIGLPSALQVGLLSGSYLVLTALLNGYGVAVAAAAGVGLKVNTFAVMPCWAVGQAVTTMVGQNMGARNAARAESTVRTGVLVNLLVSAAMMCGIQLCADPILRLFAAEADVIESGVLYLRLCASINLLFYAAMYTMNSLATGVGDATFAMCNTLLHSVVMRLGLGIALAYAFRLGFLGLFIGEAVSPIPPALLGAFYFLRGRWRQKALV
jgi:putative MATE family efflux protein